MPHCPSQGREEEEYPRPFDIYYSKKSRKMYNLYIVAKFVNTIFLD
jgi:hypothetical protein